jgi:uncharacterized protein (TIGR03067 family)
MNRALLATAILALALGGCTDSERARAEAERAKAEAEKAKAELELARLRAAGGQRQAEPFPNKPNNPDPPGKPNGLADGSKDPIQGKGTQTKSDNAAIQGTWTPVAQEINGIPQQAKVLAAQYYVFAGGKLKIFENGVLISTSSFTLNPAKSPKQIDLKWEVGTTGLGIYELKRIFGEDVLKICTNEEGKRPGSFSTDFGSENNMILLKRKTGTNKPPQGTNKGAQTKQDADAIQGTWIVVAGEVLGKPLPAKTHPISYVFAGDKYTYREGTSSTEASFTLNPAKNPKQIDVKSKDGFTQLGIYELKGDELKLCINDGGKRRPDSFATSVENNNETHVLKRK